MEKITQPDIGAVALSESFFDEFVRPAVEAHAPQILEQGAFGRFGYGSECLGLDDKISRDHHWGPQVDLLLPESLLEQLDAEAFERIAGTFPNEYLGYPIVAGQGATAGLSVGSIESFLTRTIGRTKPPVTPHDWLEIAEEDIIHIVNGKVFCDTRGEFSQIRSVFSEYYPDDVWKRRIAHWCRYASGMGLYALGRAHMRGNLPYAYTTFARTIKLTMELAHLLNRRYFAYDKWLYPLFCKLPKIAPEMRPLIDEAVEPNTTWERRITLLEQSHDLIGQSLVEQGLIKPHPTFIPSETSGYRLLEYAYGELCRELPADLLPHTPLGEQKNFEGFHADFVAKLPAEEWRECLNLYPNETE